MIGVTMAYGPRRGTVCRPSVDFFVFFVSGARQQLLLLMTAVCFAAGN